MNILFNKMHRFFHTELEVAGAWIVHRCDKGPKSKVRFKENKKGDC